MKNIICLAIIGLVLFFTSACKKSEDKIAEPVIINPLTDFVYLPKENAEWTIELQSKYDLNKIDTSFHVTFKMRTTGKDTIIDGKYYLVYIITTQVKDMPYYIREDTNLKRVYAIDPLTQSFEQLVVRYGDQEEPGDEADVPQQWPDSHISEEDSFIVNKQYLRAWKVAYDYDKKKTFFYKAYGVGRQTGFLPPSMNVLGSEPKSLDFKYKNDRLLFEFEIHP